MCQLFLSKAEKIGAIMDIEPRWEHPSGWRSCSWADNSSSTCCFLKIHLFIIIFSCPAFILLLPLRLHHLSAIHLAGLEAQREGSRRSQGMNLRKQTSRGTRWWQRRQLGCFQSDFQGAMDLILCPISYAKTATSSGSMVLGGRTSGRYLEQEGRTLMVGIVKTLMIGSYERLQGSSSPSHPMMTQWEVSDLQPDWRPSPEPCHVTSWSRFSSSRTVVKFIFYYYQSLNFAQPAGIDQDDAYKFEFLN